LSVVPVQVIAWRTVSEMTYNVSSRTLNLTHSLTHSVWNWPPLDECHGYWRSGLVVLWTSEIWTSLLSSATPCHVEMSFRPCRNVVCI